MSDPVILLVTWFVLGQPATSYQVGFQSVPLCVVAADRLQEEAVELRQTGASPHGGPQVTAICIVTSESAP